MPDIYPPREKLIDLLIDDDLNEWHDREDKDEYFAMLLRVGFVGYRNQKDQDLIDECIERELNFEEKQNA